MQVPRNAKQDTPVAAKVATLADYVDRNSKLISALGVFTAMCLFVKALPIAQLSYLLSFVFLVLTVLLWLELWTSFLAVLGDWKLTAFENGLSLAMLLLVLYAFLDFRELQTTFVTIFVVVLGALSGTIRRFDVFNRAFHCKPNEKKWLRYLIGLLTMGLMVFLAYNVAREIAPAVDRLWERIYESMRKWPL